MCVSQIESNVYMVYDVALYPQIESNVYMVYDVDPVPAD